MTHNNIKIVLAALFFALFVTGCSTMPKYVVSATPESTPESTPAPIAIQVQDVFTQEKSIRPLLKSDTAGKGSDMKPIPAQAKPSAPIMVSPEPTPELAPAPVAIQVQDMFTQEKSIRLLLKSDTAGKGFDMEPLPAEAKPSAPIFARRFPLPMPKPIQPVPTLGTHDSVSEARKPVAELQEARVAWNTPPTMTMGQSADVELRVTLDPARFEEIAKRLQSAGATTTETTELSKDLIATLEATDSDFEIVPKGPQPQHMLEGRDATWKWVISPKTPGKHILLLTIVSILEGGLTNEPLTREIFVNALPPPPPPSLWKSVGNFVLNNWDKLLTLVLIPIGGWLLNAYVNRKK